MATSSAPRAAVKMPGGMHTALAAMLLVTTVLACGGAAPGSSVASGPRSTSTPAAATSTTSPPEGPGTPAAELCGLFTAADLAPLLGAQPGAGSGGGPLGSLCEWDAGDTYLMIQKVPAEYFEDHRGAAGYRPLDKIGDYAFVAGHAFGRIAAARTAQAAYVVIASDDTDELRQIELLRLFVERSPGVPVLEAPGGRALESLG